VTNLVMNAIDASKPKGGGEIQIKLSAAERVSLQVIDHGCGIAPETLSSIFEPLFTTKAFGTGLGLSILHDLVVGEFEGTVEVHSVLGAGTTFTLLLGPTRSMP
jgi:signal transduction histidine kinase